MIVMPYLLEQDSLVIIDSGFFDHFAVDKVLSGRSTKKDVHWLDATRLYGVLLDLQQERLDAANLLELNRSCTSRYYCCSVATIFT